MSSKRKNSNPGQKQVHPQKSFQDYVAEATLSKLGGYIDNEIRGLGQALAQRQAQSNNNLMTRIIAIEEILIEANPALTKEVLANRVAAIQDRSEGYEVVAADDVVKEGDRVRVELKTRTADQKEFQGTSRLQIDNIGVGNTLGKELEGAMVGMKTGEVKEVLFGKDNSLVASISLNRASRRPVVEDAKAAEPTEASETAEETSAEEAPAPVAAATTEEAPNDSANAG